MCRNCGGGLVHYPTGVSKLFPQATPLVERGIDSYMAVPFLDREGNILGHLAVFDERPMPTEPRRGFILRIFAARATAEQERMRADNSSRPVRPRHRDLFENAPNAYLVVGTDGRVLRATAAWPSCSVFRWKSWWAGPGDPLFMPDTPAREDTEYGSVPQAPGRRGRLRVGTGTAPQDGRPLWVNVWMEPGPRR